MDRITIRRTWVGAATGALLFGAVALVQALRSGAPFLRVVQPVLVIAVIGLTVGALVGPMLGQAFARIGARMRREP